MMMGVFLMVAVMGEAPAAGLYVVLGRMTWFEDTTMGILPTWRVVWIGGWENTMGGTV